MRRSPRRPLILKRRKLPFQQNESQSQPSASVSKEPTQTAASQCFPSGIRIMDHPSMSDTQVVVIPKTADLQSVIGALTAKGKESGVQGPNKFILLSEEGCHSGSLCQSAAGGDDNSTDNTAAQLVEAKTAHNSRDVNKELECSPLDDSPTAQWLDKMSMSAYKPDPTKQMINKKNQNSYPKVVQTHSSQTSAKAVQQPMSERPPYSYMAMIQFAINSRKNKRMTLREIYMWIEDHFPYFREVAKPGWKNSIRHNLSLHDMFIRETSPDGKVSFWTIRPEANRCLTFDQMYKPGCGPMTAPVPVPVPLFPHEQQKRILPDLRTTPTGSERRMKPLLPRTDSYLVPIQLPITPSLYLQSSSAPACSQPSRRASRGAKRLRIAPKVTQSDAPPVALCPRMNRNAHIKVEVKEESTCVPIKQESPKSLPRRQASSSRRKQRLINSAHEEPVLLCPDNTFLDSGVASDASTFHDVPDTELEEHRHEHQSPDREFSFKTPIKSSSHLASSTPSKPISTVPAEPWKVTPVGKGRRNVLDFSPIRTPGGPAVTPQHEYTNFSFNSTPFKDLPLFSSPRELLTSTSSKATGTEDSTIGHMQSSTPSNRSITEGLVLDTMNDSLSKILVDISFSGLDDDDLEMANISWSEFIPQFK